MESASESAVEQAFQEALRRGLRVERVSPNYAVSRREIPSCKRWLFINGNRCQVVPARIKQVPNLKGNLYSAIRLYVLRIDFPQFIVYVVIKPQPEEEIGTRFYVVPRKKLKGDTFFSPLSGWIREFEDAWHLLQTKITARADVPWETLPPKTQLVIEEAQRNGLRVTLLRRKKKSHWAPYLKDRLLVEGRRCQVMTANRLPSLSERGSWEYLYIRVPKTRGGWKPEFVIYVLSASGEEAEPSVFIVPRWDTMKADTSTTRTGWLTDFESAWHLLNDPSIPSAR